MRQPSAIFAGLCLFVAAPASAQRLSEIYKLTEKGEWMNGALDQTLSIYAKLDERNPTRWIVERFRTDTKRCDVKVPGDPCRLITSVTRGWIDSETCPQLAPALQELAQIRVPSFAGTNDIFEFWMSHQPLLTIEGVPQPTPGGFSRSPRSSTLSRISVSEQVGDFRNWWDKTEIAIEPCWKAKAPLYDGKPVERSLGPPSIDRR